MAEEEKTKPKAVEQPAEKAEKAEKAEETEKVAKEKKAGKPKKSKKGLIIGLIIAGIVAIAGVVVAVLLLNKKAPDDPTASISYTKSFFIYDDSKYTLWNNEGKRLNEDEYQAQSAFVGGYAYVRKDDQYGIVKDDGKMSVEFGKYGNITVKGGLYIAQDGNSKEYYLITGSGKELLHGKDLKGYAASNYSGAAAVKVDDKVKIYNYDGKLIAEVDADDSAGDPVLSASSDFGSFNYNDHNIVFDARDGKILSEFEGGRYIFDTVATDRSKILIKKYSETGKYKLITDGKTYDLDETKYYAMTTLKSVVFGYDNYSELALLNNEYKVAARVDTYLELKDFENYAVEANDTVEIYHNGEKVKTFEKGAEVASSGVLMENYYAVNENGKAKFYNLDGSEAFGGHEYLSIGRMFDQFHHAFVADEEDKYYMIDISGNRVGDTTIKNGSVYDGGYEFKNSDGKYAIANKDGEPVTEFKYTSVYYRSNTKPRNIWTGTIGSGKYDVIDVDAKKVILANVNVQNCSTNYFTIKNSDGKTEYYTYDGELFYTATK